MHNYDVIAVGDAKLDEFLTVAREPEKYHVDAKTESLCLRFGEKINVDACQLCVGGDAANVAVGLSRLGLRVALFAEIGDDELSLKIVNDLARERIDRGFIRHTKNGLTSISVVISDRRDKILFSQHVKREHAFVFDGVGARLVYLTSLGHEWQKPYRRLLKHALAQNISIAFNPGSVQLSEGRDTFLQILRHTCVLFVNKEEGEKIVFGRETDKDGGEYKEGVMKKLQGLGPEIVVMTDGLKGSMVLDDLGKFYTHGVDKGKVVERTGAGDAYASGFLGAMLSGHSIPEAMAWGARNATGVVGAVGAQAGLLTRMEMRRKME